MWALCSILFFESYTCENCGHLSGFRDEDRKMLTFEPSGDSLISDRDKSNTGIVKKEYNVCNWLVKRILEEFCQACQLNRTIPNLSDEENFEKWQNLEIAKHRLIYQLKNRFRSTQ
jgi:hypothetical protein